jgi:uncharacterized membrane protein YhaH (DUF805 family)
LPYTGNPREEPVSKPIFEDAFSFGGRRDRRSFLLFNLVVCTAIIGAFIFVGAVAAVAGEMAAAVAMIPVGLATAVAGVSSILVGAQRCRDFGWSGWAVLITVLPVVGFVFALAMMVLPGTPGQNRYGPDPAHGPDPVGSFAL